MVYYSLVGDLCLSICLSQFVCLAHVTRIQSFEFMIRRKSTASFEISVGVAYELKRMVPYITITFYICSHKF